MQTFVKAQLQHSHGLQGWLWAKLVPCSCRQFLPHRDVTLSVQLAQAHQPCIGHFMLSSFGPSLHVDADIFTGSFELYLLSVRVPVLSDARISIPDISSSADSLQDDSNAVKGLERTIL